MRLEIKALVKGGAVTPAALGQSLGMAGLNIGKVVADINAKTKANAGMKVPIVISYDPATKEYEIITKMPSTAQLVLKEIGIPKGSGNRNNVIANVTTEQLLKVIRQKQEKMGGDLKKAFLQILGSCFSMGLTVDGKNPKDVQEEVTKGLYDKKLV